MRRTHFWAFLLACLPALVAAQTVKDRLTLEDYLEFETVSDPHLSPDGAQIIYTRGRIDKLNDKHESSLWIMNADGSRNRSLVDGSNARWSPAGDRIAYFAQGKPKGTQIFVRYMDAEGAVTQISHVDQNPANIRWSPDGSQIAFTMLVEDKTSWPIKMPKAPDGAKWTETPKIIERLHYRQDRQGFIDTGFHHVFVVPSGGGTARQVTSGAFDHNSAEWTPDSKSLLFSGLRADDAEYQWRESEIYAVDVAAAKVRQLTTRKGPDHNPVVQRLEFDLRFLRRCRSCHRYSPSILVVMRFMKLQYFLSQSCTSCTLFPTFLARPLPFAFLA